METAEIIAKAREYIRFEKDPFFKKQVEDLLARKDYAELSDRFYTELEFGTGGIRGVIGGGYNRLNSFIIQKTTQGLANYIKKAVPAEKASVAIAYDSRRFSPEFALDAARVLCANGITTHLYTSLRSTPQLSFTVRKLSATAGIVITASHNPPEYNGYKVYWTDGGQIIAPHDTGIVKLVRAVAGDEILLVTKDEALEKGLLKMIDRDVDEAFIAMVKACVLRPALVKAQGNQLKVVYTPLHGTGAMPVEKALADAGIKVVFVKEQKEPDGDFPTVAVPNPEEASAMKLALDLAKKEKAHLVLATDPDADRLGIAVPAAGGYLLLTGNQLGVLLLDYILSARQELGTLPVRGAFVKSIVTTELGRLIAEDHGIECHDILTGFKFIAEKMRQFETQTNGPSYLFGTEESYGYLVNTSVRDKDAVSAAVMTAEMALYHVSQGRSLLDRLNQLYEKYGYFEETQVSRYFKGESGLAVMNGLMERLRMAPPAKLGGLAVATVKDYLDGTSLDMKDKTKKKAIALPSSNVLQFVCGDGSIITARPSGTEPKIKFYASCRGEPGAPLDRGRAAVKAKIEAIRKEITTLVDGGT
ncbi:MAG TPA: phospho-sugar mutase [Chitinivibrionales bacterium]|nr:phospho-sugar mutase [Chitinivibrionales bacterium]